MEKLRKSLSMIGKIIREAREKASLSQAALSKKCGVSPSMIACIETGKRGTTKEIASKIAEALSIPAKELTKYCNRETKKTIVKQIGLYISAPNHSKMEEVLRKVNKIRTIKDLEKIEQVVNEVMLNQILEDEES